MALIDFLSDFKLIREEIQADGFGTHKKAFTDVLAFKGAVTTVRSAEGQKGQQPHPSSEFQLTAYKNTPLKFNDIVKDETSGLYYRIVNDRTATPKSAGLSIQLFTVKKIDINML